MRSLAAADPVALCLTGDLAPVERRDVVQQALGVPRGAEEPLLEQTLLHEGVAPLAVAVDDLFVGEDRLVVRAPVHGRSLLVGHALLVQLQEEPLRPLVVGGIAGDHLLLPIKHETGTRQLRPESIDISRRQLGRVPSPLDRVVLGLDPEAVEADWFEDGASLQPLESAMDIRSREREQVADVQPLSGRIRKHHQLVVRIRGLTKFGRVGAPLRPALLPDGLDGGRVVGRGLGRNSCLGHRQGRDAAWHRGRFNVCRRARRAFS